MANNEALRAIVVKALDASGTLGQIKAQVRASVYKIIEGQDDSSKGKSGFAWENPLSKKLHENKESHYLLCLIAEFLEYYQMEYSLSVYSQEANISKKDFDRNTMAKSSGIPKIDPNKSVLQQMVSEFLKGNSSKGAAFPAGNEDDKKKTSSLIEEKEKEKVRPTVITGAIKAGASSAQGNSASISSTNKTSTSNAKEAALPSKAKGKGSKYDEEDQEDFSSSKLKPLMPISDSNKLTSLPGAKAGSKTSAYGNFGGSSNSGDPYNFDFPSEMDSKSKGKDSKSNVKSTEDNSKGKKSTNAADNKFGGNSSSSNKFNSFSTKKQDDDDRVDSIGDEIDEEMPDYDNLEEELYGKNETKEKAKVISSSEDYLVASQSMGVDKSVDSMALEEYDYFEDVEEY